MPAARLTFDQLADEYAQLFALAAIRPERRVEVDAVVNRIFTPDRMDQYHRVEAKTGVPAHVAGVIHNLEASLNFSTHLHNGDPLDDRTVHVPRGRPTTGEPPFQWFDSAIDALTMHGLDQWRDWSAAGIAFVLERFNGFGYRRFHPHVKSPYLWSFTTIYSAGRYVADGAFSDTSVSRQCGGMAALKRMIELGRIDLPVPAAPPDAGEVAVTPFAPRDAGAVMPPAQSPAYPGHALRRESGDHENIKRIQFRLRALGINPGPADGDFGDQTDTAVRLFQARTDDESGEPLEVDGIVGRNTWAALFGIVTPVRRVAPPQASTLLAEVLNVAMGEVGVREVPLGSNGGPRVNDYLNAIDPDLVRNGGAPWCMAFIYWCFSQAATSLRTPNPAPRTAGVKRSWELAQRLPPPVKVVTARQAREDQFLVEPGMVFYIDTGGATGHAGFVADVVGGMLVTCEGNTNDIGGGEGIGVFLRTKRKIRDVSIGFVKFA